MVDWLIDWFDSWGADGWEQLEVVGVVAGQL